MTHVPDGLDPTIQSRDIIFEADVQSVTPFLKLATVSHTGGAHKTFACHRGTEPRRAPLGPDTAHVF